ncbi:hypothetical protein [Burkholderia cepacia]|uniref:hypothetical protein n=1 Tax=Burkholderia cepacia TaxID=292 RepID=UPI003D6714E8
MFRIVQQSFFSRAARKERLRKRRECIAFVHRTRRGSGPRDACCMRSGCAPRIAVPDVVAHDLLAIVKGSVDAAGARGETEAETLDARAWRAMRGLPARAARIETCLMCTFRATVRPTRNTKRRASIEGHRDERARERDLVPTHSPSKGGDTS